MSDYTHSESPWLGSLDTISLTTASTALEVRLRVHLFCIPATIRKATVIPNNEISASVVQAMTINAEI
jgi:hypothetical protein